MPSETRKSRGPSPIETMRRRAESGDFSSLIDYMCGPARAMTWPVSREDLIRNCIASAAEGGPAALIENVLNHLLQHDLRLLLRAQVAARSLEDNSDREFLAVRAPGEREERALDRAGRLADRVVELVQTYARLKHVLALGSKENPKAASEKIVQLPLSTYANQAAGV